MTKSKLSKYVSAFIRKVYRKKQQLKERKNNPIFKYTPVKKSKKRTYMNHGDIGNYLDYFKLLKKDRLMSLIEIMNYESFKDYLYLEEPLRRCQEEINDILDQDYNFKTTRLDISLTQSVSLTDPRNSYTFFSELLSKIDNNLRFTAFSKQYFKIIAVIEKSFKKTSKWHMHLQVFWRDDIDCDTWMISLKEYIEYLAIDGDREKDSKVVNCWCVFDNKTKIGVVDQYDLEKRNKVILLMRYLCKCRVTLTVAKNIEKRGGVTNDVLYRGIGRVQLFRVYHSRNTFDDSRKYRETPFIRNKEIREGSEGAKKKLYSYNKIPYKEDVFFECIKIRKKEECILDEKGYWEVLNHFRYRELDTSFCTSDWLKSLDITEESLEDISELVGNMCQYHIEDNRLPVLLDGNRFEYTNDKLDEWEYEDTGEIIGHSYYTSVVDRGEYRLGNRVFCYIRKIEGKWYIDYSECVSYHDSKKDMSLVYYYYFSEIDYTQLNNYTQNVFRRFLCHIP